MANYIKADEFSKHKKEMEKFGMPCDNCIPVDGTANIVPQSKDTPIKDVEDNIRTRFDLDYEGF